jgi:hypothetical protein
MLCPARSRSGGGPTCLLCGLLDELVDGHARSVALALPSERMWPLPIYELALLTAGNLREHGADAVTVWLVTPEEEPLELVGPAAARALLPMLEARDIRLRTSSLPAFVKDRTLVLAGDQAVRPEAVEDLRHRVIYATAKLEQSSRPQTRRSVPVAAGPVRLETLTCADCGRTFERVVTRGRKPRTCPTCRQEQTQVAD